MRLHVHRRHEGQMRELMPIYASDTREFRLLIIPLFMGPLLGIKLQIMSTGKTDEHILPAYNE